MRPLYDGAGLAMIWMRMKPSRKIHVHYRVGHATRLAKQGVTGKSWMLDVEEVKHRRVSPVFRMNRLGIHVWSARV